VDQSFTVIKANQSITFAPLPSRALGERPFALEGVADSGLPVEFTVLSGPVSILSNIVTIYGTGLAWIRASQSGDTNYNAATVVDRSLNIYQPPALNLLRLDGAVVLSWETNVSGFSVYGVVSGPWSHP
jgi:hypothetical protein